jgi:hypothetical protein
MYYAPATARLSRCRSSRPTCRVVDSVPGRRRPLVERPAPGRRVVPRCPRRSTGAAAATIVTARVPRANAPRGSHRADARRGRRADRSATRRRVRNPNRSWPAAGVAEVPATTERAAVRVQVAKVACTSARNAPTGEARLALAGTPFPVFGHDHGCLRVCPSLSGADASALRHLNPTTCAPHLPPA